MYRALFAFWLRDAYGDLASARAVAVEAAAAYTYIDMNIDINIDR